MYKSLYQYLENDLNEFYNTKCQPIKINPADKQPNLVVTDFRFFALMVEKTVKKALKNSDKLKQELPNL